MLGQYVSLGQRVELESITRIITGTETQQIKKVYRSKVYDILSKERLEILMPYEQRKLILLPIDSEYTMYFYVDKGVYECTARIVDRYKSNNVFILVVEILTPLKKYQRREYYRHNCVLELETRMLEEEEVALLDTPVYELRNDLPLQKCVILDISGGGLRFITDYKYEEGTLLYCRYKLQKEGAEDVYEIAGKVLHAEPLEKKRGYFEYRIQYQHIDNRKREEIIQYIFEAERKNRKKEKGLN